MKNQFEFNGITYGLQDGYLYRKSGRCWVYEDLYEWEDLYVFIQLNELEWKGNISDFVSSFHDSTKRSNTSKAINVYS